MSKLLAFVIGASLSSLAVASDCSSYGKGWTLYANPDLGVEFCHPYRLIVQVEGSEIYIQKQRSRQHTQTILSHNNIDLLMNGKRLIKPNDYSVHMKVGKGDFVSANSQENIFVYEKGAVRSGIGRFNNIPAKVVRINEWTGYKSVVTCSTSDPKTGFHAAGGDCLWLAGSDSRRNFIIDTLGDPADAVLGWKIAKSLRLIDKRPLSDKANGGVAAGFNRMFMG